MNTPEETQRILRWRVPVDDQLHHFRIEGEVLHVDARDVDAVEFWSIDSGGLEAEMRCFTVVGTGQSFPAGYRHVGSVIVADGVLVWHLLEVDRV